MPKARKAKNFTATISIKTENPMFSSIVGLELINSFQAFADNTPADIHMIKYEVKKKRVNKR